MMIMAIKGTRILTYRILPRGTSVTGETYLAFLKERVEPEVRRLKRGKPIILHDNARSHKHRVVREFLQAEKWEELEHPPYIPDMSPPDMHGIAQIKRPLKGQRFQTEKELIAAYEGVIQGINERADSLGIEMLPDRWRDITLKNGDYIN